MKLVRAFLIYLLVSALVGLAIGTWRSHRERTPVVGALANASPGPT